VSNYDITDLRADLAATIRALRDKDNPMPVDRAEAISKVASTMIESAKVEVAMINAIGRGRMSPTGFIGKAPGDTLDQQEAHAARGDAKLEHKPEPVGELPYVGSPVRGPIGFLK
jgi:hypothetical protein